jgi:hypothetical protein
MKQLDMQQVEDNWNQLIKLCGVIEDDRRESIEKMLEELGERLMLAPASGRASYHNAFPGGLVDHSLRVLKNAMTLSKTFDVFEDIPKSSLIIASLFHDLGKVGEPGEDGGDYYVEQTSDWHREKLGEYYKINDDIDYMATSLRSIFILQSYGVYLNQDEYLAIYLHDGPTIDKNKPYFMKEPNLSTLLQVADLLATKEEKDLQ